MRVGWSVLLCLVVTALMQSPVSATEFFSGTNVIIADDATINDEVYAAGQNVSIGGTITNDLLAAGSQISIRGNIGQSASLAGANINVFGNIGNNLRAAGGQVILSGTVSQNATLAGGSVSLAQTSGIGRDLQVAAGDVEIAGTVGRNVNASGGTVMLNGPVGGNVRVNSGQVTVGPNAVIQGYLIYRSEREAVIDPGAQISGQIVREPVPARDTRPARAWRFAMWLLSLFAIFLTGVVILALIPATSITVADRLAANPGVSVLAGFVLFVIVPALALILMITLIGIPLGLILLAVYAISVYISRIFVALMIGRLIFARGGRANASPFLSLFVGLIILWVLLAIPFAGWLINFAAVLFGLGAMALTRFYQVRDLRREGRL